MPIEKLDRTVLRLSGEDVGVWLDGLITNSLKTDISFAALLTPQGKIIADFFVTRHQDGLLIDTPKKFGAALHKRLKMYKLRAPITLEDISETHSVYALWDGQDQEGHVDPRLPALGQRLISEDIIENTKGHERDYNAHRLSLGIPDSAYDFETQTTFPADCNMDLINGVDFKKGCFVGQEVVSRMKRMTTVKKRFRGLVFETPPSIGVDIKAGERIIGTVLSVHRNMGMGMIRLDRLKSATENPTIDGSPVQIMGGPNGAD